MEAGHLGGTVLMPLWPQLITVFFGDCCGVMEPPYGSEVKKPPANAADTRVACSIPGKGRPTGGGNGNPHHNSCLEKSTDGEAWWAAVQGVAKSWAQLK